jgi:fucose 4-O-acetylase-like acetyltransferase
VQAIAYPYLLWSIVQGVISSSASAHTSHPVTWSALVNITWNPIAQFWFLYVLFLCQLLLLLPGRFTILLLVPVGMTVATIYGGALMPFRLAYDLPFFAAGVYLTAPRATLWLNGMRGAAVVAVLAWLIFLALFLASLDFGDVGLAAHGFNWAKGLAGAVGTLAAARLIAPYAKFLLELGRASMPIYLLHVIFAAAFRTLLLHYWPYAGEIVYAIALMLVGIVMPYAVFRVTERLGWDALFGFSNRARGPARLGRGTLAAVDARS